LITKQQLTFSGVGAHHQNGVAELAISTVTQWARSMLLHQALHWPDESRLDLWPFALEHAVYLWNHLPRKDSLIAPVELFTGSTFDNFAHIAKARVWGCPVYVLDPNLQDGNKISKWNPRSRRGMFVGISHAHSSTVGRLMNLRTGNVSPQYHIIYDDLFTTGSGGILDQMTFNPQTWLNVLQTGWERIADPIGEASSGTCFAPSLDREWLSDDEMPPSATTGSHDTVPDPDVQSQRISSPIAPEPPPPPIRSSSEGDVVPSVVDVQDSLPTVIPEGATEGDGIPVSNQEVTQNAESNKSKYWDEALPEKRRRNPNPKYVQYTHHANRSTRLRDYDRGILRNLDWTSNQLQQVTTYYSKMMALLQMATDPFSGEIDGDIHPCLLASKASQADNPTFEEATHGPHRDGFHQAMVKEIKTLTDMECWEVVKRVSGSNVLPSTWAFKMKRYPD
jgi:hypothetical protein